MSLLYDEAIGDLNMLAVMARATKTQVWSTRDRDDAEAALGRIRMVLVRFDRRKECNPECDSMHTYKHGCALAHTRAHMSPV